MNDMQTFLLPSFLPVLLIGSGLLGGCATLSGVPATSQAKGVLASDAVRNLRAVTGCRALQITAVDVLSSSPDVRIRQPGNYLVAGTLVEDGPPWVVAASRSIGWSCRAAGAGI